MAVLIANAFRGRFPGIKPDPSGKGVESPSRALRGLKKLDVNFSTPQAGLCLGISLKSVHLPDKNPKHRYHCLASQIKWTRQVEFFVTPHQAA